MQHHDNRVHTNAYLEFSVPGTSRGGSLSKAREGVARAIAFMLLVAWRPPGAQHCVHFFTSASALQLAWQKLTCGHLASKLTCNYPPSLWSRDLLLPTPFNVGRICVVLKVAPRHACNIEGTISGKHRLQVNYEGGGRVAPIACGSLGLTNRKRTTN